MAEMRVALRRNANTGKMDIVVTIEAGASPLEREEMHRRLVEKLLGIGQGLKPEDIGELLVENEST